MSLLIKQDLKRIKFLRQAESYEQQVILDFFLYLISKI
jgi:hypothetical protein